MSGPFHSSAALPPVTTNRRMDWSLSELVWNLWTRSVDPSGGRVTVAGLSTPSLQEINGNIVCYGALCCSVIRLATLRCCLPIDSKASKIRKTGRNAYRRYVGMSIQLLLNSNLLWPDLSYPASLLERVNNHEE